MSYPRRSSHARGLCRELSNPDPRIREYRASMLGWETTPKYVDAELRTLIYLLSKDVPRKQTALGEYTVSLCEEALARTEETVLLFPDPATQSELLALCAQAREALELWVARHGITPDWMEEHAPELPWTPSGWSLPAFQPTPALEVAL